MEMKQMAAIVASRTKLHCVKMTTEDFFFACPRGMSLSLYVRECLSLSVGVLVPRPLALCVCLHAVRHLSLIISTCFYSYFYLFFSQS